MAGTNRFLRKTLTNLKTASQLGNFSHGSKGWCCVQAFKLGQSGQNLHLLTEGRVSSSVTSCRGRAVAATRSDRGASHFLYLYLKIVMTDNLARAHHDHEV